MRIFSPCFSLLLYSTVYEEGSCPLSRKEERALCRLIIFFQPFHKIIKSGMFVVSFLGKVNIWNCWRCFSSGITQTPNQFTPPVVSASNSSTVSPASFNTFSAPFLLYQEPSGLAKIELMARTSQSIPTSLSRESEESFLRFSAILM